MCRGELKKKTFGEIEYLSKCKEREREKSFSHKNYTSFFINFEKNEGCVCVFFEKRIIF